MQSTPMVLSRLALGVAGAAGLYAVLLGVLLQPSIQRFALYAHKFNTLFLHDLDDPESFGFAPNQVTPFNLSTPDGETLYAWHILPVDVYAQNEKAIRAEKRPHGPVPDIKATVGFKLLSGEQSPPARVVVSFHGNSGHLAQNWRPDTIRYLTTHPNTHVVTIDYRGFGHSTGSPTEAGLITDGTTLVDWVLSVANVPSERVVIIGQSLGTAVSSAVGLHFADPSSELIPATSRELQPFSKDPETALKHSTTFAGIILVAPFSSVPALLLTYRVGGLMPILLPLRPFPSFAGLLTSQMVDKWLTAERLTAYYNSLKDDSGLHSGSRSMASLQVLHALNDADIPYHQTEMICRRMFGKRDAASEVNSTEIDAQECIDGSKGPGVVDVKQDGRPRVRFEIVRFGGHNRIITYSPVAVAVARAFGDLFD